MPGISNFTFGVALAFGTIRSQFNIRCASPENLLVRTREQDTPLREVAGVPRMLTICFGFCSALQFLVRAYSAAAVVTNAGRARQIH
jgi:hypothetical protein